jgi:hypothetical protein
VPVHVWCSGPYVHAHVPLVLFVGCVQFLSDVLASSAATFSLRLAGVATTVATTSTSAFLLRTLSLFSWLHSVHPVSASLLHWASFMLVLVPLIQVYNTRVGVDPTPISHATVLSLQYGARDKDALCFELTLDVPLSSAESERSSNATATASMPIPASVDPSCFSHLALRIEGDSFWHALRRTVGSPTTGSMCVVQASNFYCMFSLEPLHSCTLVCVCVCVCVHSLSLS